MKNVTMCINSFKGVASRGLKQQFPERFMVWSIAKSKNARWSPSYFASSMGGAPIETLKKYVESQQLINQQRDHYPNLRNWFRRLSNQKAMNVLLDGP
jgi:REP element-mobilizing transposase RayT